MKQTEKNETTENSFRLIRAFSFVSYFLVIYVLLPLTVIGGEPQSTDVFETGQDGYHTYRIPSL
ncbi:MAG: hypothetical protein J2P31_15425, partial [Blastocatellia bacterium]|nr:hypothetical protein [Blastocatellia bacterium]